MKRTFSILMALLAAGMSTTGCMMETPVDPGPGPDPKSDEATVEITLGTEELMKVGTRAADTAWETAIERVVVLVMTEDAGGVMHLTDIIPGIVPRKTGATTAEFTVPVKVTESNTKLYIVANYSDSFMLVDPVIIEDLDIMLESNNDEFVKLMMGEAMGRVVDPEEGQEPVMPMGAEVMLGSIERGETISKVVPLIRSIARADVHLTLEDGSGSFVPDQIHVYNAKGTYKIVGEPEAFDSENPSVAIAPSIEGTATATYHYPGTVDAVDPTTGIFSTMYVPENGEATTNEEKLASTCIVVGGYFNGSSDVTYYRINFDSQKPGHPFGQVLRNWQYRFNIVNVSAPGYPTPEEARDNLPVSMDIEITPWSGNATSIVYPDSGNTFTTSTRHLELPFEAGSTGTIEITSTMDFTLTSGANTITSDDIDAEFSDGYSFSDEFFDYNIKWQYEITSEPTALPENVYLITVTAKTDNTTHSNESWLVFQVGTKTMDIEVCQCLDATVVPPRVLRVHSLINYYGNLGSTYPEIEESYLGDGDAMRNILLNTDNFGPEGTVQVDEVVLTMSLETDIDDDAYAPTLRYTLKNTEVLIISGYGLTGEADIAPECVNVILDWMRDPTHTTIMQMDSATANRQLAPLLYSENVIPYQLEWEQGGGLLGITGTHGSATGGELLYINPYDDAIFMDSGPFGRQRPPLCRNRWYSFLCFDQQSSQLCYSAGKFGDTGNCDVYGSTRHGDGCGPDARHRVDGRGSNVRRRLSGRHRRRRTAPPDGQPVGLDRR